jgi:hypothetical protein
VVAACAGTAPAPTPQPVARLVASLDSQVSCAVIPNGCGAKISVLPGGTEVAPSWRPPASDPYWAGLPDSEGDVRLDPKLRGSLPWLAPGDYELVVSMLYGSDTPAYNPDGSPASDLLGRCSRDLSVVSATRTVAIQVTVRGAGWAVTCGIETRIDPV